MKIKIISDGTSLGTRIVNAETGENMDNVVSLHWRISSRDQRFAVADLQVVLVAIETEGDAHIEYVPFGDIASD